MGAGKNYLPQGWVETKIANIAELIGGGTPSRKISEYFNGDIIWLTPTEMPKTTITAISDSREKITRLGLQKSSAKLIPKGAVLLTTRASIGYAGIAGTTVTTNQGFTSFNCNRSVFNYYLAYWLFHNKDLMEGVAGGTTFKEISKTKLRSLTIVLPPLPEQKRIVARIESIFSQIDAAKEQLDALAARARPGANSLSVLKSSVLKQAFAGKLVPQDPRDEPAESVLTRVHGSTKNPEFQKKGVPKGWIRLKLEFCVDVLDHKRVPVNSNQRKQKCGEIPYYGATGQIGWIDDYLFDEELVLLGEDGAPFLNTLRNKAYIISGKSWVNNHAHVLKGIKNSLSNQFLCYFLNQFDYNGYVTGTTRLKLNQTSMRRIPISIPPVQEQKRIVARIESIFGRIAVCKSQVRWFRKLAIFLLLSLKLVYL